jgi:hypothetical protein
MGRACSAKGEKRIAYEILMGKPERKRPLQREERSCLNSIKIDLR